MTNNKSIGMPTDDLDYGPIKMEEVVCPVCGLPLVGQDNKTYTTTLRLPEGNFEVHTACASSTNNSQFFKNNESAV